MHCWIFSIFVFCSLMSCRNQSSTDRIPLAKVGSETLYEDSLPDWVINNQDPIQLKQSYINQWIRKKTMVNAAEDYLGNDLNIDQLLQDYKESLLMVNLEQELVKHKMDTFVTNMQVSQYYGEHSDDYLLTEEAIKVLYIQCQDSITTESLDKVWKKRESIEKNLATIDLSKCDPMWLDNSAYVTKSRVSTTLPKTIQDKIKWEANQTYNLSLDNVSYYLKIDEVIKPREKAPLSLIQEKLVKLILHDRKMKLMKEYENNLIEEGIQSKYIILYK